MTVTRIAPSPTGDPHLGTAFVALMNASYAHKMGGKFLLRIEDTDRARSTPASEKAILDSLAWLGLTWDEGPDVGGPNGPYRQSDRLDIYTHHINALVDDGHAFPCFCTKDDLDTMRASQRAAGKPPRYDGRCAHLSADAVKRHIDAGKPHVIRMHIPDSGACTFTDALRGDVTFNWSEIDMQVIRKSDGWPTYHAACVIDDHLMGVTDVIRGEEWIPSTPKHILLYRYWGWDIPTFHHLPLLRNPDKSKLSKRRNPTSITHYKAMGYLPDTLATFLLAFAVRGVEDADLSRKTAQDAFDLSTLSLAGPVFDVSKLDWLNGKLLRAMDGDAFKTTAKDWLKANLNDILDLAQDRITTMSDIMSLAGFLYKGSLGLTKDTLMDGKLDEATLASALAHLSIGLEKTDWTDEALADTLKKVADIESIPFKHLVRHLYITFTGSPHSLPLFQSLALMGKDMARLRLSDARALLPAVSKKDMDKKAGAWV